MISIFYRSNNYTKNNKRKASSQEINARSSDNVISPEEEKLDEEINAVKLQIGNYFTSSIV